VSRAAVTVDGRPVAGIGRGLLVLAAAGIGDAEADVDYVARKTAELRSVEDAGDEALVVSSSAR
jgi:D-Tyr-tRNAtyr deacylase